MRYYTYLWLRDDGTPYYVGKGLWKRAHRRGCPEEHRIIMQEWPCEEDAFTAERFLILFYGRKDIGTGILRNRTEGGEGSSGFHHTLESLQKISKSKKGKMSPRKGVVLSKETRKKLSNRPYTPSWRAHNSESKKGNRHALGHLVSEEARIKIGQARRGKPWTSARRLAHERKAACAIV